ncbi:MAG: asparagine synthase B [Chlorobi bacterium]|nr:asparagine synthase B [Chlorobiota bacterium]
MCGILFVTKTKDVEATKKMSKKMSHRGPDESGIYISPKGHVMHHERLSIMDLSSGTQPIQGTSSAYVIHNGEIYNHKELKKTVLRDFSFRTSSDSEVIVKLYEKYGTNFCNMLDGVFAFVVVDGETFMAGRDPIGVKPLYYGKDKDGRMYFASEMKAISDVCVEFDAFPPGYYYTPEQGFVKYFKPKWEDSKIAKQEVDFSIIRKKLTQAVEKRLMSDVPLGVLLSGGLDSSLVSAITARLFKNTGQKLHSFSVGLKNSPDLLAAKKVADFLGTEHHEVNFTIEEGIKAIEKIIWHLESYDVTTIRASTPMYFLSKAIAETNIRVVLSGEGADELFGGYLYFENAPSLQDFQKETIDRVKRLSKADCLRADKSTMAHGIEARVPFLDKEFIDAIFKIKPEDKKQDSKIKKPEKYILRKAFDDKENPYLPESILWRQKEQFSDGVGYSWIDSLIDYCNKAVSNHEFAQAKKMFPYNTPTTKEAFYFRKIFEKFYPQQPAIKSVEKWIPKWQKSEDPSGRVCEVHEDRTDKLGHEKPLTAN